MKPDETSRPERTRPHIPPLSAAWDRAYEKQGRLWGGAPISLPGLPAGSRILELGCGSGKNLSHLAGRRYEIVALDFSQHACRLARKTAAGSGKTGVIAADVRSIPLMAGSLDAVIASHIAGHLVQEDRPLLAGECARVLRPGGLLHFRDFAVSDFRAGEGMEIEENTYIRRNGILTHFFTEPEILALFSPFRLATVTTRTWPLTVRGRAYPRAEIIAGFEKT